MFSRQLNNTKRIQFIRAGDSDEGHRDLWVESRRVPPSHDDNDHFGCLCCMSPKRREKRRVRFVRQSQSLSVRISVCHCLSICRAVSVCLCLSLSIAVHICLCLSLSRYVSVFILLALSVAVCLSLSLYVAVSVCCRCLPVALCIAVSVCLCIYMSVSVCRLNLSLSLSGIAWNFQGYCNT